MIYLVALVQTSPKSDPIRFWGEKCFARYLFANYSLETPFRKI